MTPPLGSIGALIKRRSTLQFSALSGKSKKQSGRFLVNFFREDGLWRNLMMPPDSPSNPPLNSQLDAYDLRILSLLQHDNQISNQALAAEIGLSPPACMRRVKRLREEKFIERDIAVINPSKVGLPLMMMVLVQVERERADLLDEFKRFLTNLPEVMQCYVVTGRADFALLVAVRDIDHYDDFATRVFRQNPNIRHFETMVVMSRVKTGMSLALGT
ncbi:Lrp/AsnC family transcriptional regulator [Paraburkholderia tropica]|uniref:Lrp/AsnC family transcriptional regulator n=2 Tax=Paraburkholderia tropica TaxID=92647 RepID=UPI002AB280D0|nr:Lrp/AsnC family transcriptional regulator [Paraburkholderia tropica]